ncbi:hypothetical protein ULMS_04170 [Patiriisocius marinistellae]|uniref:Uncharacterized protein n=1 Tax=Patiriisocius marinistellae TaxID=2494560 RepID=A0A5J4FXS6_9FLAO|nr:hypothetical protein [Patiriisocius marinistellae]GEQ84909.1 hypothetical protein ULMS_04170 [Patiriisocius marinistellae]
MKDTLAVEIKEIANKLLATNGSFDTLKVKKAVTLLHEKLTVLAYLESQLGGGSNITTQSAMDSKSFREENWFKEPEQLPKSEHNEDLVEPLMEKIKDLVAQMPSESQNVDELLEEILPKKKYIKNDLEEFASNYQEMPTFERKTNDKKAESTPVASENLEKRESTKEADVPKKTTVLNEDPSAPKSLNQSLNKGLNIGLNDRIAFIKHLFEGNADDYQRVLSQINTFQSQEEATSFIKNQVKPDYKGWPHKEEYEERFLGIVEKRFN